MSESILILGDSGTGKSSSISTLDHETTFIVNVINKSLPFKGWKSKYQQKECGNLISTDKSSVICRVLDEISVNRPNIKTIVIDDFQYIMANEYMKRAIEKGFDKYNEMSQKIYDLVLKTKSLREDLTVVLLWHSYNDEDGVSRCKTIGKSLEKFITLEGVFTIVLHTVISDGNYKFITNQQYGCGKYLVKTPMDMFDEVLIDNDLNFVINKIKEYEQ